MNLLAKEKIYEVCRPYTMASKERIFCNIDLVEKVLDEGIEGDVVEIGVWRGGASLSMMLTMQEKGQKRRVKLYDTFGGMTQPTKEDRELGSGVMAHRRMHENLVKAYCPLQEVMRNVRRNIRGEFSIEFIKGDICQTKIFPEKISVLRLDTDWYESTKFELENFYPLVSIGGFIIIDDYGHWSGAQKAVDEFIKEKNIRLNKIDYTGVWFQKIA